MTTMMQAVGFSESKTIDEENSLYEFEMAVPEVGETDLLVKR